jgi:hypothetical protein
MFIVPKWETSNWYKSFIHYFEVAHEFPKGTSQVFTIPHRSHFIEGQTHFSPDKRVYLGPLKWPVIAIYKNIFTPTGVSNLMRLHMRLGHFNVQKLKTAVELYKTDFKDEIKSTDVLHCCPCSITKAKRIVLSRSPQRVIKNSTTSNQGGSKSASEIDPIEGKLGKTMTIFGYLIYTDILYLNEVSFKDGYKYVLSFVDCASRHCTIYFLKTRDEIYKKLEEYIVWVKTQRNVKNVTIAYSIKIIQADKAAEYDSVKWRNICKTNSIQTKYASPTLHEDAAVAERVWETIQDLGRVLMYTARFMKNEWPLAFWHACYIYNRMPHPHLNNTMCPFEFVKGIKPDLSKLRIFGCTAYAYIDPSRRDGKFADRAKTYIYVGNDDETNGYHLYNRTTQETTTQGIVKFVENVDVYGKVLSTYDQTFVYNYVYKTNVPNNFIDTENYNDNCGRIYDIDVYFSNEDQQTFGIVQLKKEDKMVWVHAESLFQHIHFRLANKATCKFS